MNRAYQYRPSADRLGNAEEWRDIPSAPGYKASSLGRILGKSGRVLSLSRDTYGYLICAVYKDGVRIGQKVHRLVCEAFHGLAKPDTPVVAHIDGCRHNNVPHNLMWATHKQNSQHMIVHGTKLQGDVHPSAKLSKDVVNEIWLSPLNAQRIVEELCVSKGAVKSIRSQHSWREYTSTLPPQPDRPKKAKITIPDGAVSDFRAGMKYRQVARKYSVSPSTAYRWELSLENSQ